MVRLRGQLDRALQDPSAAAEHEQEALAELLLLRPAAAATGVKRHGVEWVVGEAALAAVMGWPVLVLLVEASSSSSGWLLCPA